MYRQSIGLIDDITSAISDVTGLFKSLATALQGDQVPEYPIKSNVAGESPMECYLSQCGTDSRWKGEQLQKRIELLEVLIQFYAPKKRVKKDV